MPPEDERPSPEALLQKITEEEKRQNRGRLKIFFGACAGVGKTYAMLLAACSLKQQGEDVVAGIVETHGRRDTQSLLNALERLPLKHLTYRGRQFGEFDLDAALARQPALILVDELAHTNIPGCRHEKRWQDVEELLAAGINVYTTLNVQHIESLNDVVGAITGVRVRETVPDQVFDDADEVVLVDLPPDELLQRLKEGKVYLPRQARQAMQAFFRKGNLIALREIALRRMADRVNEEMRAWRRGEAIQTVWGTRESFLVCVGPDPGEEKTVRSAARLAAQLDAPWHAVAVETPGVSQLPEDKRSRIFAVLRLADELGAESAVLAGDDPARLLVQYARSHNLGKIVLGRNPWRRRRFWHPHLSERIARLADDLDILEVVRAPEDRKKPSLKEGAPWQSPSWRWQPYAAALGICALATALATPLFSILDLANIAMIFLLVVLGVAIWFGSGPAMASSFFLVAVFDYFFVPPRFSFTVSDVQYLITFSVMLAVALVTGQLAAALRHQVKASLAREGRTRALFETAKALSAAFATEQIAEICAWAIEASFGAKVHLLLLDEQDRLFSPPLLQGTNKDGALPDLGVAQWVLAHEQEAGLGTGTLSASPLLYLPLKASMATRGVLAVEPKNRPFRLSPEERRHLEIFTSLIGIAVERIHYMMVAQEAMVKMEAEKLRHSIVAALSQNLRAPVLAISALAEELAQRSGGAPEGIPERLMQDIRSQALKLKAVVENLLDMARLQKGEVSLQRAPHDLAALAARAFLSQQEALFQHEVLLEFPQDLPLVECDGELIERVFEKILANAGKYTPKGTVVRLAAKKEDGSVRAWVEDNGPGIPPGSEEEIFAKFTRGPARDIPGVGLGLSITRAIIEAHKGRIWAENIPAGGARFTFVLPMRSPSPMEELP